ncbi:hypothetical protein ACH79_14100 [Bradyrhizobium sp. CCBAU 051011]|nr:hypothetical protein ACH79_14100 [Bradyrhizobium sp. CCBAU 051011]
MEAFSPPLTMRSMPRGKVDHAAVERLQEFAGEHPQWSRRELARRLDLNHSLVTRALAGHPVTDASAKLIGQGLDRLRSGDRPPIDVAFATELLHLLQQALSSLDRSRKTKGRRRRS